MSAPSWQERLITELRQREMLRSEIATMLAADPRTLRKYLKQLGTLVVSVYDKEAQQPRLRLTNDTARVDAFLEQRKGKQRAAPRTLLEQALCDSSRHFHILQDDEAHPVRLQRVVIARDSLVSALFGETRA